MNYFVLTDTEFFRQVSDKNNCQEVAFAYSDFIRLIFSLYTGNVEKEELQFVLTYTEIELQSLDVYRRSESVKNTELSQHSFYLSKAILFIRHILRNLQSQPRLIHLPTQASYLPKSIDSKYKWTGGVVELVEIIYGFIEMRSINNGETPITELARFVSNQFGIEIKDCYSAYVDIKRRKNASRTYYLDKMRERLNQRMELDDEAIK
jgi:hypothetical protein